MTTALVKFEKYVLAKMDTATLIETIDRSVLNAKERVRAWRRRYETETGEAKAHALMRMDEAKKRIDDYLDEQMELFRSRGMNKFRAYNEAIVPTGEVLANGKEVMRIVKREETIQPFDDDDQVSYADRKAMEDAAAFDSRPYDDDDDGDSWRD